MDTANPTAPSTYLRAVRLRDYKCFADATIELDATGLTFIVGQNNAGKSILATGLNYLGGGGSVTQGSVAYEWAISPLPPRRAGGSIRYYDHELVGLAQTFSPDGDRTDAVVETDTGIQGVQSERSPTGRAWIPIERDHSAARRRSGFFVQPGDGNGSVVPSISLEGLEGAERSITQLRNHPYTLSPVRTGTERSTLVDATPDLLPDGSNLPNVLLWLQTREATGWTRVRDAVEAIVPGVTRLLTKVTKNQVEVVSEVGIQRVDRSLKDLGTGVEQVLLVAVACETQNDRSIVILDEPEVGVHPAGQRELLERLRGWAATRQIVVITHSPFLLEGRNSDEPVYLVTQLDGLSNVQRVDGPLWDALDEIGVEPRDAFGVRRVLIAEGRSDVAALVEWFPALAATRWIALIDAEGGTRVRSARAAVSKTSHIAPDKVWAVLDADEGGSTAVHDRVHVLRRRELENFFLDQPAAVLSALREVTGRDDPATADQIAEQIREAADGLQAETVWLHCRAQLMRHLDRGRLLLQRGRMLDIANASDVVTLVDAARNSYPDVDSIQTTWDTWVQEVGDRWEDDWQALVPGARVLDKVWHAYSCAFDKMRDTPRIAAAMRDDKGSWPADLQELTDFVDKVLSTAAPTEEAPR